MKLQLLFINCKRSVIILHSSYYSGMRTGRAEDSHEDFRQNTHTFREIQEMYQNLNLEPPD